MIYLKYLDIKISDFYANHISIIYMYVIEGKKRNGRIFISLYKHRNFIINFKK